MTRHESSRHALVFGASGFVGRYLVHTLVQAGAKVTAAVRSAESGVQVQQWLNEHGVTSAVDTAIVDFDAPQIIAGDRKVLEPVTEIHNCAGSYRFGMTAQEARAANVGIVEKLIDFAATLPNLERLVHISGYRVGGQDPATVPWTDNHRADMYRRLGAYEASKVESDAIFQARSQQRGVAWTIVNPASVIGDSLTGESDQLIGLATTIEQIYRGTAAALPKEESIFLPVVTVDYLARFMSAAAVDADAAGKSYWVLDDDTPPLVELLTHIGRHLGAKVPKLRVPVAYIRRLPRWITKADPETLTFMSSDRYPTAAADELAARNGIEAPDILVSLERWADYLAAHRFGAAEGENRRFVAAGGLRTFELGAKEPNRLILPGLPLNADTWAEVTAGVHGRVVDLPGLGLSGGRGVQDWERWLLDVLPEEPTHLIGHSVGAAAAVMAADLYPRRVASLALVSPFFLQPAPNAVSRMKLLTRSYLRHVSPTQLSRHLTGHGSSAAALESSVSDLKRDSSTRVAEHLALVGSTRWRAELMAALGRFGGPIRIIVGSLDPLAPGILDQVTAWPNVEVVTIQGAGHHPQLTHSKSLVESFGGRFGPPTMPDAGASMTH